MSPQAVTYVTRAMSRRHVAVLAVIALCATALLALQLVTARQLEGGAELAQLAARQPSLVARAAALADLAVDRDTAPGERMLARRDLETVLARIEAAHEALTMAATERGGARIDAGAPDMALLARIDGPLRAYVADARALIAMADLSPSGAARRLRAMHATEPARLAERLERMADLYDARQSALLRQRTKLQIWAWIGLLGVLAGIGAFVLLPLTRRVAYMLNDARAQVETARKLRGGRPTPQAPAKSAPPPLAPPRVLLAAANPLRDAAGVRLKALDCVVTAAQDAGEAKRLARAAAFDLIVFDVTVAYAAARDLAAPDPDGRATPCLAIVSDARAHMHARLRAQGVAMFVETPLKPDEFEAAVRFVLDRRGDAGREAA